MIATGIPSSITNVGASPTKKRRNDTIRLYRKDKLYEPILVGYNKYFKVIDTNYICPDCKNKLGEKHITGCDMELCPRCGKQLVSCKCGPIIEVEDDVNEVIATTRIKEYLGGINGSY